MAVFVASNPDLKTLLAPKITVGTSRKSLLFFITAVFETIAMSSAILATSPIIVMDRITLASLDKNLYKYVAVTIILGITRTTLIGV